MKRQELQAEYDRIKHQIGTIKSSIGSSPDELISLSCQTVCVTICGSLEYCLKGIFVEYSRRHSGNRLHRAIERLCDSFQNPKSTKVLEMVKLFDKDFGRELELLWEGEQEAEKSYLDNLVGDRIEIAHRKKNHVGVSTGKLENYYKAYSQILDRVYDRFLGRN